MQASSEHDRGSLTPSEVAKDNPRKPRALVIGGLCSLAFLGAVLALQTQGSSILKLPAQWLAVAAVPVLVGLMVGGYTGRVSFAGVDIEAPSLKRVQYFAPVAEPDSGSPAIAARPSWTDYREEEYERSRWLELVHVYRPSTLPGQDYDISIYLSKHIRGSRSTQISGFADIDYVEFYFGPGWGDQILTAHNDGGVIGVNTSAWGSFLAICRVTFRDHTEPVLLRRYIDYEMASAQQG